MIDDERFERLVSALEEHANASRNLLRFFENERAARLKTKRGRKAPSAAAITVTPLVRASVERALRKSGVR